MANKNRWCLAAAAVVALSAAPVFSQDSGLAALQAALGLGQLELKGFQPRPLMTTDQERERSEAAKLLSGRFSSLPAPDAATLAWLSKRVPGLDAKSVKQVSFDLAEKVMALASDKRGTWMDVLSDPAFRGPEIYFVGQAALDQIENKYASGLIPVRGKTTDGKPFQMQGFLAGQGNVDLLFNWTEFQYEENGHKFKIDNNGRLRATIRGAGDVGIQGFSAYGAPIFCPWARIQRMTKESMYKVRVETSCGTRGGNDLRPVRRR